MIGAHPDDCEIDGGGTAILMASIGHSVKFVSITTGDAGHLESRLPVLQDGFQRPKPFRPDIVVDITAVTDNKIHAMAAHESQFFEWLPWIGGYAEEVPKDNLQWEPWLKKRMEREMPEDLKKTLDKWYGAGTSGVRGLSKHSKSANTVNSRVPMNSGRFSRCWTGSLSSYHRYGGHA